MDYSRKGYEQDIIADQKTLPRNLLTNFISGARLASSHVETITISTNRANLPFRFYKPTKSITGDAILYFHGN